MNRVGSARSGGNPARILAWRGETPELLTGAGLQHDLVVREVDGRLLSEPPTLGSYGSWVFELDADHHAVPFGGQMGVQSTQLLADSAVFVTASGKSQRVIRYWPATGRKQTLFSSR